MDRAFPRYLRFHRTEGHTPKTIQYHRDSIEKSFFPFLVASGHGLGLDALNVDTVLDWVDDQRDRGLAQKTISTKVISVKAFSKWLVAEDFLAKDPLARFKVPKVDDKAKDTLTPAEVEELILACNRASVTGRRDIAILLILFSTGLRASELVALQAGDLDWKTGLITIRRGKGGKPRVVPMGTKVERALDRYLGHQKRPDSPYVFLNNQGGPLTYRGLWSALARLEARTGIHANPHRWRHTAAIQYLRNGGKVEHLKNILGHTTITMSLHYARASGADLAQAHELADPARSLKVRV